MEHGEQAAAHLSAFESLLRSFIAREFEALRACYTDPSASRLASAVAEVNSLCADGMSTDIAPPARADAAWYEDGRASLANGGLAPRTLFQLKAHSGNEGGIIGQAYLSYTMDVPSIPRAYASLAFAATAAQELKVVAWYDLADEDDEAADALVYLGIKWVHRRGRHMRVSPPAMASKKFVAPGVPRHVTEFEAE
jgi:hypothetical protein